MALDKDKAYFWREAMMQDKKNFIEKIMKKIEGYQYVSFDLFDTLIKRNVQKSDDVFRLIENQGIEKYGNRLEGFYRKRVEAEKMERLQERGGKEVTLHGIYRRLLNIYNWEVIKWAEEKEKELEIRLSTVNYAMIGIYKFCVKGKKRIQITTDMYLPYETILAILEKTGITGWDNVWVSSKVGFTKLTGKLFDYELGKLCISAKELIHIGDNKKSDYLIPKRIGIGAIRIKTWVNHMDYPKRDYYVAGDDYVMGFINNNILGVPIEQRVGFECMGPLLYGFSDWLIKSLHTNEILDVYFFSRDGWILKKAFDLLNDGKIRSHYFYTSRRALQIPLLAFLPSYFDYIRKMHWPSKISIVYFLYNLGIEDGEEVSGICSHYGISSTYCISKDEIAECRMFQKIYADQLSYLSSCARIELENLHQYILQENMSGKFAVVDIGWRGNMQKNLLEILKKLNISADIYGYYVGVDCFYNHSDSIRMQGFVFGQKHGKFFFNIEKDVNSLFEEIFMAPHGSVKAYEYKDGIAAPVLYPDEQNSTESVDLLVHYQNGALAFVEKISEYRDLVKISSGFSVMGVLIQFIKPTFKDAVDWGKIIFKDISEEGMVIGGDFWKYLINPRQFKTDYKKSKWKVGFLKRTFRLKLDYYKVAKLITQFRL